MSGKVGGWKISERMEKWKNRKDLVFPRVCLVEGGRKVEGWKTFLFSWRKKWENEKCSLYKLTITSLLYNSGKVRVVSKYNEVGVFM